MSLFSRDKVVSSTEGSNLKTKWMLLKKRYWNASMLQNGENYLLQLIICIDFETIFGKLSTCKSIPGRSNTTEINEAAACSFSVFMKSTHDRPKNNWSVYWQQDGKKKKKMKLFKVRFMWTLIKFEPKRRFHCLPGNFYRWKILTRVTCVMKSFT